MLAENLGKALRELRVRQHLSLRNLAGQTGFSPSFLSQVENAQSSPSLASIEKITAALGISLSEFFQEIQASNGAGNHQAINDEAPDIVNHRVPT
jgi:transcriptional regulator with XRE-family HTH domain